MLSAGGVQLWEGGGVQAGGLGEGEGAGDISSTLPHEAGSIYCD